MRLRGVMSAVTAPAALAAAAHDGGATPVIDPGNGGTYAVTFDPADFVAAIDNLLRPLTPGSRCEHESRSREAEDMAEVVRMGDNDSMAFGSFRDVMVTEEWPPLEPDMVELKYHAPGIGVVLEVQTAGGSGRTELVSFEPGEVRWH